MLEENTGMPPPCNGTCLPGAGPRTYPIPLQVNRTSGCVFRLEMTLGSRLGLPGTGPRTGPIPDQVNRAKSLCFSNQTGLGLGHTV